MCLAIKLFAALSAVVSPSSAVCSAPTLTFQSDPGLHFFDGLFHVRVGYTIEAYCSSGDSKDLLITSDEDIDTEIVNSTTVKIYFFPGYNQKKASLTCSCSEYYDQLVVQVHTYPDIYNLTCLSSNFGTSNCEGLKKWKEENYARFLTSTYNSSCPLPVCDNKTNENITLRFIIKHSSCVWDEGDIKQFKRETQTPVILKLQSCNALICEQSMKTETSLISKKKRVNQVVKIWNGLSGGAEMAWIIPFTKHVHERIEMYYKVELLGKEPRILANTLEGCLPDYQAEFVFTVPCPGKDYMMRVSVRPAKEPPKYISDFGYTSYREEIDRETLTDMVCDIRQKLRRYNEGLCLL